ncbi:MAG: sugar isomerase [Candidatus Acetothermia bacterium]|nr:sugar isomerase [Candidatus Acetothermia bacterium]
MGGLQSEGDVEEETRRITDELGRAVATASFDLEVSPVSCIGAVDELARIKDALRSHDVSLLYAAGGGRDILEGVVSSSNWSLIFLRHKSGPLYTWYEIIHPSFLRGGSDEFRALSVNVDDVVVDDYNEVIWRLRALHGLKNSLGKRIVAIGSAGGWGIGSRAARLARARWGLDIIELSYPELAHRIRMAKTDPKAVSHARAKAEEYLAQEGVSLRTDRRFVVNAFVLYQVLRDVMNELEADAVTVDECMSTIIPLAETTACLPLSVVNDEGGLAFCESDFVVIPAGILLHYISGKPVFLADPTYPYDGQVTVAHCTAPRRMAGKGYETANILTHFESDYAAPRVAFTKGQAVTAVIPDFRGEHWIGFKGRILDTPSFPTSFPGRGGDRRGLEEASAGDARVPLDDLLRGILKGDRICPGKSGDRMDVRLMLGSGDVQCSLTTTRLEVTLSRSRRDLVKVVP